MDSYSSCLNNLILALLIAFTALGNANPLYITQIQATKIGNQYQLQFSGQPESQVNRQNDQVQINEDDEAFLRNILQAIQSQKSIKTSFHIMAEQYEELSRRSKLFQSMSINQGRNRVSSKELNRFFLLAIDLIETSDETAKIKLSKDENEQQWKLLMRHTSNAAMVIAIVSIAFAAIHFHPEVVTVALSQIASIVGKTFNVSTQLVLGTFQVLIHYVAMPFGKSLQQALIGVGHILRWFLVGTFQNFIGHPLHQAGKVLQECVDNSILSIAKWSTLVSVIFIAAALSKKE